jgi:hypothetical protein
MNRTLVVSLGSLLAGLCATARAQANVCGGNSCAGTSTTITYTGTGDGLEVTSSGYGVYATSSGSNAAGVYGSGTGTTNCYGVWGEGTNNAGVYGHSDTYDGVHGVSLGSTHNGVTGINIQGGMGVYGEAAGNTAVYGTTTGAGASGVVGYNTTTSSGGNGVYGQADGGYGVSGYDSNGGIGVIGECSGTGCWAGYFSGLVYINGTTYGSSDACLNKNITPVAGAIDQLLQLKGVTFDWKEPEKHADATGTQIGFIAQDVEKVFPNWVRTGQDGFKTLTVGQIEALEVESIRTLKAENEELRTRVNALETNRRPLISGLTAEGTLFGFGFVAMAGAFVVSRRRRDEKYS